MTRCDILDKLGKEFKKNIKEEAQVVYILSRIRKIIEIENSYKRYPVLAFYCNWALHSKIDKMHCEEVNNVLKEFILNQEERYKLFFHLNFFEDMKLFLKEHGLEFIDEKQIGNFRLILEDIISDTPVVVTIGEKYKVVFKKTGKKNVSGSYVITREE